MTYLNYFLLSYTYIEATGQCSVHLINEGVQITPMGVAIEVQITGPSSANRLNETLCILDGAPIVACEFFLL